jgi:hypothetical protein
VVVIIAFIAVLSSQVASPAKGNCGRGRTRPARDRGGHDASWDFVAPPMHPRQVSLDVSRPGVIAMRSSRAVEEEIYTHEYLWRSASMLVRKRRLRNKRRIISFSQH